MSSTGTQLLSPRVLRSPRQLYRSALREVTGRPSIKISVFSGPMPRMSIWRLLPRSPEAVLPVKLTPGMVRTMSERSFTAGRCSKSCAVILDTPSDCCSWRSAVTYTVGNVPPSCGAVSSARANAPARASGKMPRAKRFFIKIPLCCVYKNAANVKRCKS